MNRRMHKLLPELLLILALPPIFLLYLPLFLISSIFGLFSFLANSSPRSNNASKFFSNFRCGGHRGSPSNAPENTMVSFTQAEKEGVDLIEFDIGLTKDKVAVIMHDDSLDRTTNMTGPLREKLWVELASCNCAAKFQKKLGPNAQEDVGLAGNELCIAPMASLEQVVRWAKARGMKMIFDVKETDKELTEQVEQIFETFELFDSAIICSFFPEVIYRIKRHNKNILTGITWRRWFISYQDLEWNSSLIWHGIAMIVDVLWMWSIKLWVPQFLGVDMVLTERGEISENYVEFMRTRGLEVCAWTVNDECEMAWMAHKLKIPFLTDMPDIARAVIKKPTEMKQNIAAHAIIKQPVEMKQHLVN